MMEEKPKAGLSALRDSVAELRAHEQFHEAERTRKLTVRMLNRLGIAGYSEPGNPWVRVKNFEVRCVLEMFEQQWIGRSLGSTSSYETAARFDCWSTLFFVIPRTSSMGRALVEVAEHFDQGGV